MLSCRERKTHKYGFAGVIGRGYSLTWQEREKERLLVLSCSLLKPQTTLPLQPRHVAPPQPSAFLLSFSFFPQNSTSSPHHIPISCFPIPTFLTLNFPQITQLFSSCPMNSGTQPFKVG